MKFVIGNIVTHTQELKHLCVKVLARVYFDF